MAIQRRRADDIASAVQVKNIPVRLRCRGNHPFRFDTAGVNRDPLYAGRRIGNPSFGYGGPLATFLEASVGARLAL
jgi:hypothetical protein